MGFSQTILIVDDGFLGRCFADYLATSYSSERIILLNDEAVNVNDSILIVQQVDSSILQDTDIVVNFLGLKMRCLDWFTSVKRYVSVANDDNADVVVNISRHYGPRQLSESLLFRMISQAFKEDFLVVREDETRYDWTYILDCCTAIDMIMRFGKIHDEYDVCSGFKITDLDIAKSVLKSLQLPMSLIDIRDNSIMMQSCQDFDCSKLRALGWSPKIDFDVGLMRTIEWHRANLL
jgi:hypothetical protein